MFAEAGILLVARGRNRVPPAMQRFFAAIILMLIALAALCMVALIVCAGWLLLLDNESRNRLVTEIGANPAWNEPQFILIQTGIPLAWLACVIICFLKGKPGSAIVGIAAGVAQEIGLPPIGGYYILNLLYPLWLLPLYGAIRLARPDSYYANWFYRRNLHKYWRSVERFGMIAEYATMIAGNIELSNEFEVFLRRKLTPEQRLSGLKTTEAAEVAKLSRMGTDAYLVDKQAELEPIIDEHIAKLKEQEKKGF
jgi:hypothetical protein